MALSVILPVGIGLKDWANCLITDFIAFGAFDPLDDETKWQDWATQFLNATNLIEDFPDPYMYDDWREWAERFVQTTL